MAPITLFIHQMQKGRTDKKIVVRASRIWKSYNTKKDRELMSMDFLAIDEKSDSIHCSIRSKFVPDFEGLLKEGAIYSIKNFSVVAARPEYRVVENNYYILLDASTFVEEMVTKLPKIIRHKFNIVRYELLLEKSDNRKNLCDVIGYVVGMSDVGERTVNSKPVVIQYIDLEDTHGNKLRITLWGNDMTEKAKAISRHERVWIVCSTIVRTDFQGNVGISSSSATDFICDESIPEIKHFTEILGTTEHDREVSKILMSENFITKEHYDSHKKMVRDVNEIVSQCEQMIYPLYVYGYISLIEEENGWKYNGCTECHKKVKPKGGKFHCENCKRVESYPELRYRIEAELGDGSDVLKCVVFDREVEKLINIKAIDLLQIIDEEGYEEPIPRQIRQIVGKCFVFQIEFNEYSRGQRREYFTVKKVYLENEVRGKSFRLTDEENAPSDNVSLTIKTPAPVEKRSHDNVPKDNAVHKDNVANDVQESTVTKKARKGLKFSTGLK